MKSLRGMGVALGSLAFLVGCGLPQTGMGVTASSSAHVSAQSKEGLTAALKIYLSSLFKRLDVNGDNKLSATEAKVFFTKDQFDRLDVNNNGYVTLSEVMNNPDFVAAAIAKLHEYAATSFDGLDVNKDGKLTWQEFQASINSNALLTTSEKMYAQLAFDLADKDHNGYLSLDEYEDMVAMAMVQSATTAPTLVDAFQRASAYVTGKYGAGEIPMALSISWMNKNGQFTKSTGAYAFTYWCPVSGAANTYAEVTARVSQSFGIDSVRDDGATHSAAVAPVGLAFGNLITPTQAISTAVGAGIPTVGDRTSFYLQYLAATTTAPDRVYVSSYQAVTNGDKRLGGVTLDARTGNLLIH